MGQEISSPIKCAGDENIKYEQHLEKVDPNGDQKQMHVNKHASTPQNSSQRSILTFNPDDQSVLEKVDQRNFQVPISFRKEEEQSLDKINESPIKSSLHYFSQEDIDGEEKVKKTSPIKSYKQYSQTAKNSPNTKSPISSISHKQLNQSPLTKMLEDLEVKRKKHQEIQNMGYPKGFSPTKLQMIQELMEPQYQEVSKKASSQRKKTPEQSDQFVSKLLQKGEEIKHKHQVLQDQQLSKELSECTFQPTLEKSSNLYNSGIFNSKIMQSQASNGNIQRSIQDQSNYPFTSSIQQQDSQYNYSTLPNQQQNRPQFIQENLKNSFGNNQINTYQPHQQQQQVENIQQKRFQQPQPHEQQPKIEKHIQFKLPQTQQFQQPYQNQQSSVSNLNRIVPYSLQNSPQNNKSTIENSQASNQRDSTPKTKKSSLNKLNQISKQKLISPQSVTWQKDISPRSTLSNQYSYRTPNSTKSPSSSQQIQQNQSNLRQIIQESNNSPRINQRLFHKKDENQSYNEMSNLTQNNFNKSNHFNQSYQTYGNQFAQNDSFDPNKYKVSQDKNILKQANQNFISNHVPNSINNNLNNYQLVDKFNHSTKNNMQGSKIPTNIKNQDFSYNSKSVQSSPKNYSFQNQFQIQQPKQNLLDYNSIPNNISSNNISQLAQNKAIPTSNLLAVPSNANLNNFSKNPLQQSNDEQTNQWKQKELFYPQMDEYQYKQSRISKNLEQSYASLNPNNNSLSARSRSWKQFLDDQNKFSDIKELNIQHVKRIQNITKQLFQILLLSQKQQRVNIESTSTADFIYQPEISKKSKLINSNKLLGESDVFKRLNNLVTESVKKKYRIENDKTPEKSRGYSTNRLNRSPEQQEQLYNRLYEDASVRKEKNKQLSDEVFTSITTSVKPSIATQRMNDYCLAQKFVKDFEEELSHVVNSESVPHSYSLNYNYCLQYFFKLKRVSDIAKRLRFISDKNHIDSFNYARERALLNDLWAIMNGQVNNGIRSRNLLLFFFAVHGINIDLPIITSEMLNNSVYIQSISAQKINIQITDIKPADKLSPDCEQYMNTFGAVNQHNKSQVIPSFNNLSSDQKYIQNQKNSDSIQSSLNNLETPFNPVSNQILTPRNNNSVHQHQLDQSQQETSTFIPSNINKNTQIGTFDPIQNWSVSSNDLWYLNRLHSGKSKDLLSSNNQDQPFSPRNGVNGQSQILNKSQSFISPYKNKNTEQLATNHRQRMIQIANVEDVPLQNNLSNADIQNARKLAQIKINEKIKQEQEQQELNKCTFHPSGYLVNSNRLQRNLSGLSNSNNNNKKVVLLKKSKKIGLNYFLIEIILEDGLFKIIADDAENPTRKVLEMSESDGTKILKKYFGNSLDQMLESIWITDKIFIRGLEMYTSEEQSYQSKNSQNKSQSPSPCKNLQISKTQPDEKHRLAVPLKKSSSNKTLNVENTKIYNKQLSSPMQIIEQPDQESFDMSNSNLINSKLYSQNNRKMNPRSVTEEDSVDLSKDHSSIHKRELQNKSQIQSNSQKIDEDGFNEYGDEDYDDNESENIRKIKDKEGNINEEIQELNFSQNINNDF